MVNLTSLINLQRYSCLSKEQHPVKQCAKNERAIHSSKINNNDNIIKNVVDRENDDIAMEFSTSTVVTKNTHNVIDIMNRAEEHSLNLLCH